MIRQLFCLMVLAFLLSTCGTSTQIKGSWKEEGIQPGVYNNIAVLALTEEQGRRRIVENEIIGALKKRGINATASYSIFPEGYLKNKPGKEAIQQQLESAKADGLLTVALLDVKEETHYNPGTAYYGPYPSHPYYRGYYGYYSHWYPTVYEPGYYTQSTNIFLESNLYNVASGEMVWTAQSQTVDPSDLTNFADSYASAVVKQLMRDKVLEK